MAMNDRSRTDTGHPLPCGRTVEAVWDDLEAGRTGPHADCPHCTTSRRSLADLAEATRALVDDPAEPPPGLLDRIMAAVRADLGDGDTVALPADAGATVEISTQALTAVLRYAVDTVDGLRALRCHVTADPARSFAVDVELTVSVRYGTGSGAAVEAARARVRAALSDRVGIGLARLTIGIADVWTEQ